MHGRGEKTVQTFGGNTEGKIPLGRPRHVWEVGIKVYFTETGCEGVEWIQLAQDRNRCRALVKTMMKLRVLAPWSE
jgi:hypothetical protein